MDYIQSLVVNEIMPGGRQAPYFGPQVAASDDDTNASETASPETHRWRTQPPLLPPRMATLVSTVSGATRLSLEIAALFWEAVFDAVAESTSGGRWLGTAAANEGRQLAAAVARVLAPLTRANPRIVSRAAHASAALGGAVAGRVLAAAEGLVEGGFTLSARAVNLGLHAAGEYVRMVDAVFGATDTSRVLASFVHMCRHEALENNPEVRALVRDHGRVGFAAQVVKTVVAWGCLQVVTRGRAHAYRLDLVHTNIGAPRVFCARRFVASDGSPMPAARTPAPASPGYLADEDMHRRTPTRSRARSATVDSAASYASRPAMALDDSSSDDDAHLALSDQEGGSFRDVEWNRRLVEALHGLSAARRPHGDSEDDSDPSVWAALGSAREPAGVSGDSSESDSSMGVRPTAVFPAFESAPASLVSSPQFAATPARRRSSTAAEGTAQFPSTAPATTPADALPLPPPNALAVPGLGMRPTITPILDLPALEPETAGATAMQQEFPRKPLLFNLARFISVASSAYGRSFMRVIGLDRGMIDARALLDAFGDPEPPTPRLSRTGSAQSLAPDASPAGASSRSPRAQPMSSYHAPRSPRPAVGGSRRPRRAHHARRPVSEHPNHCSFAQHTGIPLGDLLFSSYVPPLVPGVSLAASAQASAVERKLRHQRSLSAAKRAANDAEADDRARQCARAEEARKSVPAVQVPAEVAESAGWLSGIPLVGAIYGRLPSPLGALSAVPGVPSVSGLVSRTFGMATDAAPPSRPKREPTARQVRRFDKLRRRLVYRNPSIHALVHYIAVDHATRAVVLACRGTLGISDLFVDMICEYERVRLPAHQRAGAKDGVFRAHAGMWHSALLLADASSEVFKEVAEALRMFPEYGLVITGHSLGGGVASLLTLLWSQPLFDHADESLSGSTPGLLAGGPRQFATAECFGLVASRPIHCFSFGSPCSTNAALSYYCRGLVTSLTNADDFVSFLSVGAFMDLLNISAVLNRERGVAEKIMRGFLSRQRAKLGEKLRWFDFDFSKLRAYDDDEELATDDEQSSATKCGDAWGVRTSQSKQSKMRADAVEQEEREIDDWHLSLVKTLRANMDSEKLYPPGDVFVLAAPGDDQIADAQLPETAASKAADEDHAPVGLFYCPDVADRFTELRFSRNMIVHHLPSTYERRLSALVHEAHQTP